MDFTQTTYKILLETLKEKNYSFFTFENYLSNPTNHTTCLGEAKRRRIIHSCILLRHDIDRIPRNALKLAQIENSLGIKGTYYFRVVPESYDVEIMHQISALGHEIGYHYEEVDLASKALNQSSNQSIRFN